MSYYSWLISWLENANNLQLSKVQASICLIFCQFQPDVAYKSVTNKKACNIF